MELTPDMLATAKVLGACEGGLKHYSRHKTTLDQVKCGELRLMAERCPSVADDMSQAAIDESGIVAIGCPDLELFGFGFGYGSGGYKDGSGCGSGSGDASGSGS